MNAARAQQDLDPALRGLLADVLGLPADRVAALTRDLELFGALPEFDSMAVANLLTGIEDRFHLTIEDDEVEAEDFLTYGSLLAFVERVRGR
ncbi:acyl carrier protein [Sphingomonas ginkgonis]|uniref:Acyl carrier protein n=1 Tax=Sphingomonas ginkgonis TaxID=2315330 RepID=A0A3R9X7Q1_9SPHN|nr:phosphopantetheine-binding protein [Sphingomonas ginkgonis]RST30711.1 acyl carrier protein [Sphingomonas ginkgonis]